MFDFLGRRGAAMLASASVAAIVAGMSPAYAQEQQRSFDIPSQPLSSALVEFSRQADVRVMVDDGVVNGRQAPALRGSYTPGQALEQLLAGSGLRFQQTASGGYAVQDPNSPTRLGDAEGAAPSDPAYAEILVVGRRTLNADIRRTEDDAQPYVIFSGEDLERAGVSNLEEFLETRLPMNTQTESSLQGGNGAGNIGRLQLRGLSSEQTLILVNGRRIPNTGYNDALAVGQPNLNGIPVSAIERIDVLPATSGGIYGGSATAGVINIILKRDYTGFDIQAGIGSSFESDAARSELSLSGGWTLDDGRTSIMLSASRAEQDELSISDRDYQRRARELQWANNPASFTGTLTSTTPNVCAAVGASTACSASAPNLVFDPEYGSANLGTRFTHVPVAYGGPATGVSGLVDAAGEFNFASAENSRSLLSGSESETYSLTVRHDILDGLEGFLDLGFGRNSAFDTSINETTVNLPAAHPDNPFQQNIAVRIPLPNSLIREEREIEAIRATGGLLYRLTNDWTLAIEHSWSRSTSSNDVVGQITEFAGATAYLRTIALRDSAAFPIDLSMLGPADINDSGPYEVSLSDTIVRFSGPVWELPAGALTLSGYAEQREERVADAVWENVTPSFSGIVWYAPKHQEIHSAYLEVRVPFFSEANALPLLQELELFAAIRADRYDTRVAQGPIGGGYFVPSREGPYPSVTFAGNEVESTDYSVGIRYRPIQDITFRASFGTGFLPPNLAQIVASSSLEDLSFETDPARGDEPLGTAVTQIAGGNATIQPEESESFSVGFIFTPRFLPGFRASIDYVSIEKSDEIWNLPIFTTLAMALDGSLSDRVVRGPNLPGDDPDWLGPITQVDVSAINTLGTEVEAIDIQLDYEIPTEGFGNWRPYLIATQQTTLGRQTLPDQPLVNTVGFRNGPLEWRANFGVRWEMGGWNVGWDTQYFGSRSICTAPIFPTTCNRATLNQGASEIPEQFYHDGYVAYDFGENASLDALADVGISFGIQNIMDESPEILATTSAAGYDVLADPRGRRFVLTLRKHFN